MSLLTFRRIHYNNFCVFEHEIWKFSDCSGSIIVWPCCPVCGRICWFAALLCNNTNNTTPETADKAPRHTVTRHSPLGKIVDLSELVWSQWGWAALDTGHRREVWSVPPARGGDSCWPLQSSHHWRFCSTHFQTAIWCPKTDTAWHSTIKMRPPFVILCTKAFKFSLSCQLATISCQNRQWWRGTKQQPNTRSPLIRAPKVIHDPTLFNLKFPI